MKHVTSSVNSELNITSFGGIRQCRYDYSKDHPKCYLNTGEW